ncbi:hypothetical protein FRB95_013664 [Tulasnella sp. JGI-2019a]|nr:hypothetical protein FRB95_013664 [Tulasnella sp. JGI-2019a]
MSQSSSTANLGTFHSWMPNTTTTIPTPQRAPRKSLGESLDRENIQESNRSLVKQAFAARHDKFLTTNGQVRHGQSSKVAPYPMSYDRAWLEMDELDHAALWSARSGPSDFDFKEYPERSLDLGCGTGRWVLDTARVWKTTQFVGFDLVSIQPDPSLYSDIADRIQWVHGNFLTRLPFDDHSFDHVYARSLEMAIPENKWDFVLTEIVRVLKPGGAAEFLFNDIIFPFIPFTDDERSRICKAPVNNQFAVPPPPSSSPPAPPAQPVSHSVGTEPISPKRRIPGRRFSSRARKAITRFATGHDRHRSVNGNQQGTSALQTDDRGEALSPVRSRPVSVKTSTTSSTSSGSDDSNSPPPLTSISETMLPRAVSPVPPVPPLPNMFTIGASSSSGNDEPPRHLHEWLEELFYGVFSRRFINLHPTRIVPIYLQMHLEELASGNPVRMQMPAPGTIYAGLEDGDIPWDNAIKTPVDDAQTPRAAGSSLMDPKAVIGSLTLNTDVPPPTFNPISTVSSSISASTNFLLDDPTDHLESEYMTPVTSFSRSNSDSAQGEPDSNARVTGLAAPSAHDYGRTLTPVAERASEPNEHEATRYHTPVEWDVQQVDDVKGRRSVSALVSGPRLTDGQALLGQSVKKRRPSLKRILATQALTIMLVKQLQMVIGCKETMFEELLIRHGLSISEKSSELVTARTKASLRKKFNNAFDHYVSDMRAHAAIADGLVYTLDMKRPLKARLTPTEEECQQKEREEQVARTLALVGRAFTVTQNDEHHTNDSPRQQRQKPDSRSLGDARSSTEPKPVFFRSTRAYAGFTPISTTEPIPNDD